MSAGADVEMPTGAIRYESLELLAPKFRAAVQAALADCDAAHLDAMVYETYRTDALQRIYYARGRTIIPPYEPVTNAADALHSWHGFSLAVDVIHRTQRWSAPRDWFRDVARHFKAHGCSWGGDWTHPDLPHLQWGRCRPSPSDHARELYATGGITAVWNAVGAT